MTASASEAYLKNLADRTFLKLWALPNTFYKPGVEMTDLIVPFGEDIIIISDKASTFDITLPDDLAWSRWAKGALKKSQRQLEGAWKTVSRRPDSVFMDRKATVPSPIPLGPAGTRRLHLVGIARPDLDPHVSPSSWPGLTYVSAEAKSAFEIGKLETKDGVIIHLFDGPTIDLLLSVLDTAPDFIAYLKGREAALRAGGDYRFCEKDLLAAAMIGWEIDTRGLPSVPPLKTIVPGLWDRYVADGSLAGRQAVDGPSRVIDQFIEQQYEEFAAGRLVQGVASFETHENAMRLLASEWRFARRVISHELYDILDEKDQTTFWAATVASPANPELRYVWLTYPRRPSSMSIDDFDRAAMIHLQEYLIVAQYRFKTPLVLGICLPNRSAADTAAFTALLGGEFPMELEQKALALMAKGVFANLEASDRLHFNDRVETTARRRELRVNLSS